MKFISTFEACSYFMEQLKRAEFSPFKKVKTVTVIYAYFARFFGQSWKACLPTLSKLSLWQGKYQYIVNNVHYSSGKKNLISEFLQIVDTRISMNLLGVQLHALRVNLRLWQFEIFRVFSEYFLPNYLLILMPKITSVFGGKKYS